MQKMQNLCYKVVCLTCSYKSVRLRSFRNLTYYLRQFTSFAKKRKLLLFSFYVIFIF